MSKRSKHLTKRLKETSLPLSSREWFALHVLRLPIKKSEPVTPSFVFDPEPRARKPVYDYVNLFEVATTSWPLRRAFRAIIQESMRRRWRRVAKFAGKCPKCEKNFPTLPSLDQNGKVQCDVCKKDLILPSQEQALLFDKLLDKPNRDYHFDDFVRSSIWYDLSLDDWYWGVAFKRRPKTKDGKIVLTPDRQVEYEKVPAEIYVEDARFIFPVADDKGHLGGYEYFCPLCYDLPQFSGKDYPKTEVRDGMTQEQVQQALQCPVCKGQMEQTAYVQEINGVVFARFTRDEIIHGSSSRVAPELFGNSKIISVWKLTQTVLAMDDYNWEVYSEGKVGSLIGFPGSDAEEVTELKESINNELKELGKKDVQTGRFTTSRKIRTLLLGLKRDQEPIRIPLMEDLKNMQSLEFYRVYIEAIASVYGVTPEFVSVSEPGGGSKLKIEVQNRTTEEIQSNFVDLFNSEVLPRFGIIDWVLAFNPIEERDRLREAQVSHTKAAAAFTWLRGGFEVGLSPEGDLLVSGVGKIPAGEAEGSRADQAPRAMEGKPRFWQEGEATRTQGEAIELREDIGKAGLPISWYSATQIRVWNKVFALNNDQDEVYVMVNGAEIEGTRVSSIQFNYAVANLLDQLLRFVGTKLSEVPGFNEDDFESGRKKTITSMRREFDSSLLVSLANYFDSVKLEWLGEKIDSLRIRLEQAKPKKFEAQTERELEEGSFGEMLEPFPEVEQKSIIQARAPFGVVHQEDTLYKNLMGIVNWAKEEVKKSPTKREKIIHEAKTRAVQTLDASYEELTKRALSHARRRTGKKRIGLSPEELKRLEVYKKNSLEDFERILRDSLK